jgi:hypothetical protein
MVKMICIPVLAYWRENERGDNNQLQALSIRLPTEAVASPRNNGEAERWL